MSSNNVSLFDGPPFYEVNFIKPYQSVKPLQFSRPVADEGVHPETSLVWVVTDQGNL